MSGVSGALAGPADQHASRARWIVLDNLSAHKTKRVKEFLDLHENVHLHFTPTYSSWLMVCAEQVV